MMDMGAKKYAYEYELAEWEEQFKDTDGNEMDDSEMYWRIPLRPYGNDQFILDDQDSINRYLRDNYEDAGNNQTYQATVNELQDLEPYTSLEPWSFPVDAFHSKYMEE
ncbi:hypothetical protein K9P40_05280 [Lentilactobacillus otakiensis]|uniref:hypothetical protein n=1 Tax=Lentilactobacillus otakiensis TaxID=481720 RepID=UPI001CBE2733|nr:hypothetical protein [Lentilactobacillus otakiensis]MBZ3776488.1 hypothetical protein [Lentilactobacillus otakiensis]